MTGEDVKGQKLKKHHGGVRDISGRLPDLKKERSAIDSNQKSKRGKRMVQKII